MVHHVLEHLHRHHPIEAVSGLFELGDVRCDHSQIRETPLGGVCVDVSFGCESSRR